MTNLNFFTNFNSPRTPKNCPHNCLLKIKGLIWIDNQPFWTSQCSCGHYYFEKGKTTQGWGGFYD